MDYKQKSARLPRSAEEKVRWRRVIVILEHCPLQVVQTDKGFELLRERHRNYHARHNNDPAEWRPDVVHQCLLHLQDSALSRAGMLQVFLRTKKGVCIEVDPRLRVPRHMRLFEKMMVMLLYKMKVRASVGYLSLMRVVKNPVTDRIPANAQLIRVERDGEWIDPFVFAKTCGFTSPVGGASASGNRAASDAVASFAAAAAAPTADAAAGNASHAHDNQSNGGASPSTVSLSLNERRKDAEAGQFKPFAFIVGGMSKGDVEVDYAPLGKVTSVRLGDRGMSAAAVLSTLMHAFEEAWLREDVEACQ